MTTPPTFRKYLFVMENEAQVPKPSIVEPNRVVLVEKPHLSSLADVWLSFGTKNNILSLRNSVA